MRSYRKEEMKRFLVIALLVLVVGSVSAQSKSEERRAKREAQKVRTAVEIDSLIGGGAFTFWAGRAVSNLPSRPYITLDGRNFLQITATKIDSFLPFYGVLYSAPYGAANSPLSFESEKFTYKNISGDKPGKHLVRIEVLQSTSNLSSGGFTIIIEAFDDASAVATVTMNSGSTSMFYGRIEPNKE